MLLAGIFGRVNCTVIWNFARIILFPQTPIELNF